MQRSFLVSTSDISPFPKDSVDQVVGGVFYGDAYTVTASQPPISIADLKAMLPARDPEADKLIFYPGTWEAFLAMMQRSGVAFSIDDADDCVRIGAGLWGLECRKTYGGVLIGSRRAFEVFENLPTTTPVFFSN